MDITKLGRLVSGIHRDVDLSVNTLVVDNLKAKLGSAFSFTFAGSITANRTITVPDANVNLGLIATAVQRDGSVAITGNLLPDADGSRNLGSSGNKFYNLHAYILNAGNSLLQTLGNDLNIQPNAVNGNVKLALNGTGALDLSSKKIINLAAGTASGDAVNKGQMDALLEGLKPKAAVRVATTANIVIATGLNAGDVIDGVTLANGDRVLAKDQTAAAENGIYVVSATPSRSTDFDSLSPVDEINGSLVAVQEGTANAGKVFVQSGAVVTLDTDPINFVFFNSSSSLVGGDGITVSGSNISVDHDGEGLQIATGQLSLELDGTTLAKSATGLKVGTITSAELGAASVTNSAVATGIDVAKLADGSVSNTELQYINSLTSNAQTQLDGKANQALSNLTTSAVNVNLLPGTSGLLDLGSSGAKWRIGYLSQQLEVGTAFNLMLRASSTTPSGATAAEIKSESTLPIALATGNNATANGTATNAVLIESGNKTAGSGNSGNIVLQTGTSAGGTRGQISLNGSAINANSTKIINVTDPTSAQDVATKAYVDAQTGASSITSTEVANEALSATTIAVMRWAVAADAGFVAGRVSIANNDASSADLFYAIGVAYPASSVSAGGDVVVTRKGALTVTAHGFTTIGAPIYLTAAGALTQTAPTAANSAIVRIGFVKTANILDIDIQVVGVN